MRADRMSLFMTVLLGACVERPQCTIAPAAETGEPMNRLTCSGEVLASGSMENSDDPADAETWCQQTAEVGITCCSFHLYGEGEWYATDGDPVAAGGVPDESEGGRAAGACVQQGG